MLRWSELGTVWTVFHLSQLTGDYWGAITRKKNIHYSSNNLYFLWSSTFTCIVQKDHNNKKNEEKIFEAKNASIPNDTKTSHQWFLFLVIASSIWLRQRSRRDSTSICIPVCRLLWDSPDVQTGPDRSRESAGIYIYPVKRVRNLIPKAIREPAHSENMTVR